jgi:hypothetical protein
MNQGSLHRVISSVTIVGISGSPVIKIRISDTVVGVKFTWIQTLVNGRSIDQWLDGGTYLA